MINTQSFVKQLVHWTVICSAANESAQTGMQNGAGGVTTVLHGTVTWKGEPGMWSSPHLTTRM